MVSVSTGSALSGKGGDIVLTVGQGASGGGGDISVTAGATSWKRSYGW